MRTPGRLAVKAAAAVTVTGAAVVGGAVLWDGPTPDRTAAGTTIGGLPAGGLDAPALSQALQAAVQARPDALRLTIGTRALRVASSALGREVDVEATVDRALAASRQPLLFGDDTPPVVEPVLREVPGALEQLVDRVVDVALVAQTHGSLAVQDGRLTAVPPADGQHATVEQATTALQQAAARLVGGDTVTVPVEADPAEVTAAQVQQAVDVATRALTGDLTMAAGARTADVVPARLLPSLVLAKTLTTPPGVEVIVDRQDPRKVLADLVDALSTEAREPALQAPAPTALLTEKGSTSWTPRPAAVTLVSPGAPGQAVTADAVADVLDLRLGGSTVPMAVTPTVVRPRSSDAAARQVDAALGTFTTGFACCPPRVTNIRVMARELDGLLIAPGEQFSLNGTIGRRTAAKGYVDAPFILDGELSTDIGGGVSQVATTLLNAAFFAGLKLDAFQAHSFYISRYPPGREATVNFPGIDLRFTNDTPSPVLLRTAVAGKSITVTLYGKGDGRQVSGVTGARRPLPGKRDFAITVTRTITVGGATRKGTFTTRYNDPPEEE